MAWRFPSPPLKLTLTLGLSQPLSLSLTLGVLFVETGR
jgi:hypothetical protein